MDNLNFYKTGFQNRIAEVLRNFLKKNKLTIDSASLVYEVPKYKLTAIINGDYDGKISELISIFLKFDLVIKFDFLNKKDILL